MDACLSACARTNGDGGRSGGGRKKPTLCWPLSLCGRGGSPVFRSLFPPPMRGGWRAERRSVRISPDGPGISRAVTHHTDAPASPDAPFAASVRFRVSRWPATRGLTPASLLRRPLGGGVTTPARKYRIPFPSCGVPRRTPSLGTRRLLIWVKFTQKSMIRGELLKTEFRQQMEGCSSVERRETQKITAPPDRTCSRRRRRPSA